MPTTTRLQKLMKEVSQKTEQEMYGAALQLAAQKVITKHARQYDHDGDWARKIINAGAYAMRRGFAAASDEDLEKMESIALFIALTCKPGTPDYSSMPQLQQISATAHNERRPNMKTTEGIAGNISVVEITPNNIDELKMLADKLVAQLAEVQQTVKEINNFKMEVGFKNK